MKEKIRNARSTRQLPCHLLNNSPPMMIGSRSGARSYSSKERQSGDPMFNSHSGGYFACRTAIMLSPVFVQGLLAALTPPPSLEVRLRTAERSFPTRTTELKTKLIPHNRMRSCARHYLIICRCILLDSHFLLPSHLSKELVMWGMIGLIVRETSGAPT